ncbi:MAG: LytTR family DNA-binding domain-containing protein [Pseudoxanthomonas suwonensis]|nr:LytTR family DNA-binding domain-containing protein [Pseudoxanthomonas suwonensis]
MRLVIADDEPLARERLRELLDGIGGVQLVAEAGDGQATLDACAEHRPDAVLLDIAMPGIDGLEAARQLRLFEPPPAVIFCTAYDAHALSAFEAAAVDYLVKPVRRERLAAALERARIMVEGRSRPATGAPSGRRTRLSARLGGQLRLIPVDTVDCLRAEEKYVVVHHAGGEDLLEESLKSLEDEFAALFVRIHRNCLVARKAITGLQRDAEGRTWVLLRDGALRFEASRRCLPEVREVLRRL